MKESNNMGTQLYRGREKTTPNLECTQITTTTPYHATSGEHAEQANEKANQYFHTNRKQRFMTTAKRPNKPFAFDHKKKPCSMTVLFPAGNEMLVLDTPVVFIL